MTKSECAPQYGLESIDPKHGILLSGDFRFYRQVPRHHSQVGNMLECGDPQSGDVSELSPSILRKIARLFRPFLWGNTEANSLR